MKKIFYLIFSSFLFVSCSHEPVSLNVMTYNIRYDNPKDGLNNWKYRKDVAAEVITSYDVDLLGTQEVLFNQLKDLKERLPQYNVLGVGREDGIEKGEYSALFYKKEKFEEIESGYFWLSATPDSVGSKGWDGACERIATWVILKDKKNGKEFFALNTHLDHVGKIARREGVKLLLNKVEAFSKGLPVIMTGDFNAASISDVIKHITDEAITNHLTDSKTISQNVEGTDWTFHDFGKLPFEKRERIDYIFVNKGFDVTKYKTLPAKLNGRYVSDHTPIYVKLNFK